MTFSQRTGSSTTPDDAARRTQLVAALERAQGEVKSGRSYIAGLEAQVKGKQDQIDALNDRDAKRVEVEASLQKEITDLQGVIASQKADLKIHEDEVTYLKGELAKVNKKLQASQRRERVFFVTAVVLGLTLFFKR